MNGPSAKKLSEALSGDLFGQVSAPKTPAHQPSSDTSKEAALRIVPKTAAMRENVYRAIAAAGNDAVTRKELESITGYLAQTLCARLNELETAKRIRKLAHLNNGKAETMRRDGCALYVICGGYDAEP